MLFAFFGFWATTLLAGAAAVSVPIIIHLLNRKRYRIVSWAAMRFLLAAQKQNSKRLRLEQLILLLLRCTIVLLIVLAMAAVTPWAEELWAMVWPDGAGGVARRGQRLHHVLVLDGSLSMNLGGGGRSSFDRARQLAIDKVKEAQPGDGFSVLLLKDTPTWIVGEASQDHRRVQRELEALRPGHGNAGVPTMLSMVAAKLTEAQGRFPSQAVFFFTDMQRATWMTGPSVAEAKGQERQERQVHQEMQEKAKVVFVDVGREDAGNVAVLSLRLDEPFVTTGQRVRIKYGVKNFGKTRKNVKVDLLVGRAKEGAQDAAFDLREAGDDRIPTLEAGEFKEDTIAYQFPGPGTWAVQVKVDGGDDLDIDDARSLIVTVKDTIPVLLVNGKPAADRFERATEYLRLALNPFPAGAEPKFAPLRPKVVSAPQFNDLTEAELAAYDCIFFCDVTNFVPGDLRRLDTHLRRGGGAVFALGEKAAENLDVYNRLLFKNEQGYLPGQLLKKITAPNEHHFYLQAQDEAFDLPPLKAFADSDDKLVLRGARFHKYIQVKPSEDAKARPILSFMPELAAGAGVELDKSLPIGNPAVMEWNPPLPRAAGSAAPGPRRLPPARYRGKVVLIASTVNMDWTSWPGSPSFGALMQEMTRLAVSGRLREQAAPVGGLLEEYWPANGSETDVTVHFPANVPSLKPGKTRTQLLDDVNLFRWTETDYSGIYKVVVSAGPLEAPFAVNFPASTPDQRGSESDLSRIDESQLQNAYPGWKFQIVQDARQAKVSGGPVQDDAAPSERAPIGPSIAHVALIAGLVLLFLEVVLAWQFGHYSAAQGQTAQPATGLGWPLAVAIAASILFLIGGWVLIHAHRTGDFLAFLPDTFRGGVERSLGLPPAPPGESTRWELDYRPFLWSGANEAWLAGALAIGAIVLLIVIYRSEAPSVHPAYKAILGCLRFFLILMMLSVLLPQLKLQFDRQGWPDVVVLLDTSRSMGEPDLFQDDKTKERAKELSEHIKKKLQDSLPGKIQALQTELNELRAKAEKDPQAQAEVEKLSNRLLIWQSQLNQVNSTSWQPTRLQLAQALLAQPQLDWLHTLLTKRRMKVHVYALDSDGRAAKLVDNQGPAGEILDPADPKQLERAHQAVARLEAEGNDSRLGTALRQVIDHYRGSSLAAVIMVTDGVTTRDETIAQVGEYAAQKAVPLFFVGLGDEHEIRDLKLHDLAVGEVVYVGDNIVFEARLTGKGFKDLTLPVVLKVKEKDGREKELNKVFVKIDQGRTAKVILTFKAKDVGRKLFIVEVEPPKAERPDKALNPANLRLERMVEVIESKLIKVLYVEGQPRYEYRYIKALLEREDPKDKRNRTIDLKVLLLDADANFAETDKSALVDFPTRAELDAYDVIIMGDADPRHPKLGMTRLKDIADFVRGEDRKGKKTGKNGGGLLMAAGTLYNPHAFKDTPLADVIPIEPGQPPAEPDNRADKLRLELTPVGRAHAIFRFSSNDGDNQGIWQGLAPMFWWSSGYRLKPLAEVLAVHPGLKAEFKGPGQDLRHPLVVEQFVGSGRTMFFGFEESWRWRYRHHEVRFNQFWIETIRYLSRARQTRTDLRLDRQTSYRMGEPIKVMVKFSDNGPDGSGRMDPKTDVKVTVEYRSTRKDAADDSEIQTMQLAKVEGSSANFEAQLTRTREGKYRFRLTTPDVSKTQPDGEKPYAEATVELPPGELDRLRMNQPDMTAAAEASHGKFYTLVNANELLEELPAGFRLSVGIQPAAGGPGGGSGSGGSGGGPGGGSGPVTGRSGFSPAGPGVLLWNHWLCFILFMLLVTGEWFLRKRKHLL